jgi:hypothetical protein
MEGHMIDRHNGKCQHDGSKHEVILDGRETALSEFGILLLQLK